MPSSFHLSFTPLPSSATSHVPKMASTPLLSSHSKLRTPLNTRTQLSRPTPQLSRINKAAALGIFGAGLALKVVEPASASEILRLGFSEPANALSLPTWAVHVSSVAEWITAMILVWQYGERPGFESWKGLSWGMVPSLGGALCACTWHFFYNAESLEILVAIQAALTVIGNATMCFAAFRIYNSSQQRSEKL